MHKPGPQGLGLEDGKASRCCDTPIGTCGFQGPCRGALAHPGLGAVLGWGLCWGGGCAGVGSEAGAHPCPALTPLLSCPAVYAVHNLSEVSLTQYELDSK